MNIGSDERLEKLQDSESARASNDIGATMALSAGNSATASASHAESSFAFSMNSGEPVDVPEEFGRYKIAHEIGRGAMGTVYLAHDTQLDRDVAIKVPKFDKNANPKEIERFYREARAMAMLRHANLCPVYDVGEIDHVHYLTMAYIDGHTLSHYIEPNKMMPNAQAAEIVRKLVLALEEAHQNGIIHRDLKPANIMIDNRNEPVIMDFGLARRDEADTRLTQTGALLGTPAYMSPEQIDSESELGPGCDIYAIGVILYEMLAGQLPFKGNAASTLIKIVTTNPAPPSTLQPKVDQALEAICLKALAKKVEQRFASAKEMANALSQYLQTGEVEAAEFALKPAIDVPLAMGDQLQSEFKSYDTDDMIAGFNDDEESDEQARTTSTTGAGATLTGKIEVACKCGAKFAAKRELVGKTLKCPKCGGALSVGDPSSSTSASTAQSPTSQTPVTKTPPITVSCECGARFAAKRELAGRKVKCAKCSRPLQVPSLRAATAATQSAAITIACGKCGSRFAAKKQLAGKTLSCRKCGASLVIPKQA